MSVVPLSSNSLDVEVDDKVVKRSLDGLVVVIPSGSDTVSCPTRVSIIIEGTTSGSSGTGSVATGDKETESILMSSFSVDEKTGLVVVSKGTEVCL